ncbi:MAG: hypothetical protein ACTSPF_05320, partial [Candidatus Heimdallarchaeaceae archaeon]
YVLERKQDLIEKAESIVNAIKSIGSILDSNVLYESINRELLHAPQLDSYRSKKEREIFSH